MSPASLRVQKGCAVGALSNLQQEDFPNEKVGMPSLGLQETTPPFWSRRGTPTFLKKDSCSDVQTLKVLKVRSLNKPSAKKKLGLPPTHRKFVELLGRRPPAHLITLASPMMEIQMEKNLKIEWELGIDRERSWGQFRLLFVMFKLGVQGAWLEGVQPNM